ncbi:MAG: DUF58 domain-containing protein [Gammaproteobacteria bacterium]|nr:MAG: DUF58 domain-containing protein [Gammaproteobacteria bacterium]
MKRKNHQFKERAYCSIDDLMRLRFDAKALQMPSAKRGMRQQTGQHRSKFRGRGMEFAEVRVYQPGDDVRTIDWRVTARRQKPHTKLFHEERERPICIICDQSISQFFGSQIAFKSVVSAEITALLSWAALFYGDRVGGIVFSDSQHHEIKPARNRKSVMGMIKAIEQYNQALSAQQNDAPRVTLNKALLEARRISKPGGLVFIVSDFQDSDADTRRNLHQLAQHNELIAIQVYDPMELQLPPPGIYPVSDGQDIAMIRTDDKAFRNHYAQAAKERQRLVKEMCDSTTTPLILMSTRDDPVRVLKHGFFLR